MQKFGNTLITNQGRAMLTAVDGAQGKLTYTKAILSTQDTKSMSDDDVRALEQLSDDKLETPIDVVDLQDNTVTIGASFNNAQVSQDLKFNSIGWLAKTSVDGQEKLLAVTPSESEQTLVAGSNGQSTASTDIELVMARNSNTTVTVNPVAMGFINDEQLKSAVNAAKNQLDNDVDSLTKKTSDNTTAINKNADAITKKANTVDVDSKLSDINKKVDSKVSTSDYTSKTTAITETLNDQSKRLDNVEKIKADSSSVYTQDQINSQMAAKADKSALSDLSNKVNTSIQHDVDSLTKKIGDNTTAISNNVDAITKKANSVDVYTRYELDPKLADKADKSEVNVATPLFREISNSSSWKDIFGVDNPTNVLTSLRIDPGSGPLISNYAAGIGFGGVDTKGVLSVDFINHDARITSGNGGASMWSEDIAWKSDVTNLQERITALENAKPIKASSQDDAVVKSKSSNGEYYW